MPKADIKILYASELTLPGYPTVRLDIEDQNVVLQGPGEATVTVTTENEQPVRILFRIWFPKSSREISAVAQSWEPTSILLDLAERQRMVGTIQAQQLRALGADAVERECDMTCLPPARQTSGPARCVVCTDSDGVFELCC